MDYLAKLEQADNSVNGTLSKPATSATMPQVFQSHELSNTPDLISLDAAAHKCVRKAALMTLPVSIN
jgi:hypothetical protein